MAGTAALDTTFDDPMILRDEVDGLLFMVNRVRAQFAWKVDGLDAAALNRRHPPSMMTLGGLVKHLALGEATGAAELTGQPIGTPWDAVDRSVPNWEWPAAENDAPEALYGLWRDAVARNRAAWAHVLAAGSLDDPAPWDKEINLRRALIDLIEQYLRHTGHADLIRESIDGLVGEDPPPPP